MHRPILMTLAALAVLAGCIAGCQPSTPAASKGPALPQEMLQDSWPTQEVPVAHIIRRDYRLREGDQIEIIYHVRHRSIPTYRLKIEDDVNVHFPFHPNLNQTTQVLTDGTLKLDLVGSVPVLNKSVEEVRADLMERYGKFLQKPEITITFVEFNKKIAEIKKAITTAPRGQSRLVPITPDGTVSLPFIVNVRAAGKTVDELHLDLNRAYVEADYGDLEVTVNVQSVSPIRVYILGEVRIPGALLNKTGALESNHELSLLQAIAQAGSYIPARAELSRVCVIRRRHLSRPGVAVVNVYQMLENQKRSSLLSGPMVADSSKYRYDLWLEDGDIIYVPTTAIAKRADYIEYVWARGIRAVPGFSTSASYGIGDAVDWVGPNP